MNILNWFKKKTKEKWEKLTPSDAEVTSWYRDSIYELYNLKSDALFSNSLIENQKAFFEFVFRTAKTNISIYTEKLPAQIFDDAIIAGFVAYAIKSKGIKIDIVVKQPPEPSKTLDILREYNIPIYQTDLEATDMIKELLIMDDTTLRVQQRKMDAHPYAIMYDKKIVSDWQRFFGILIGNAILKKSTI